MAAAATPTPLILAPLRTDSPVRHEALARAFGTGFYSMQQSADHFRVHYATVSRALRWREPSERNNLHDCKT